MKVLDLFSGIGGFSLGLERAGMKTVTFCEIDEYCRKVLKKHWPNIPIHKDVKKIKGKDFEDIDLICGGFPCVDISFAGKREGILKGKQSSLWGEYARIIREVKPKYVIIENVGYLRKNGLGVILNDLSKAGYDSEWRVFYAQQFGLPHKRERLFIVSYTSSKRFDECSRERGFLQVDEEWKGEKVYAKGEQCESESGEICKILSKGRIEIGMSSFPNKFAAVSDVCRVTNGIRTKLDENRRKQRIKMLGNSVVPQIAELIGKEIMAEELASSGLPRRNK